jgi:TolB-like protein/Tfp pilus assembly protein PilF
VNSIRQYPNGISRGGILEQLARIMLSKAFQGSERSVRLLKFLVEHAANGPAGRVKEYTLGTEVLGKPSSFDPRTDTIVRAEISRLRSRLEKYYATEGQTDPVVISLPKGSYEPQFRFGPESRDSRADPGRALRRVSPRARWFAAAIGFAACLIVLALSAFWRAVPEAPISVAVLPFANLSGDVNQEFLSDGITQELITALAKIPDLRVVARESAFQLKGQNRDTLAIAQQVHAPYLIAGSVRRSGNRIRVTAQLIKAEDGTHVWADSYDRELTDMIAIQEDIARAIAGALRRPIGLKPGQYLVSLTDNLSSYEDYLRGRAIVRARGARPIAEAIANLEQAVARDPDFAPAWAQLSLAYELSYPFNPNYPNASLEEMRRIAEVADTQAEEAARRAIQLDPNLTDGYVALARMFDARGDYVQAEELYLKALALDPYNPEALSFYSNFLAAVGRLKEDLVMRQRGLALEPLVPQYITNTAMALWLNGQSDAALAMLRTAPATGGRALRSAVVYASEGRYAEAASALEEIPPGPYGTGIVERATRLLRAAPRPVPEPQTQPSLGGLSFVFLHVGAPERALDWHARDVEAGYKLSANLGPYWHPSYTPVRKTERFKTLVRETGLIDYWRTRGWPETCHPTTGDDFECG